MRKLNISIEINGQQIPAGTITWTDRQNAAFAYSEEYLKSENGPISISLPLQEEPFTAGRTRNFFEGLLPEGFARKSVADWIHAPEDDYLTILETLGEECLGAILVSAPNDRAGVLEGTDPGGYEELSAREVKTLAREGISKSTDLVVQAHLSLTGASGKVGLYYDENSDRWFLPKGTAPSTHIVKQSHIRLGSIVTNEQLCMTTARALGMEVPDSFIIDLGQAEDEDILFATKRYDRILTGDCRKTNGLPQPLRLHQEDFAQALGISAQQKYEQPGQEYLRRMFNLIRANCTDPITDQMKLWELLIFDFLIGNTDNHIKNISLLYDTDMKRICMAPAYDIISTCVYGESSRDMAVAIGGELDIRQIGRKHFEVAAGEAGLGRQMAMRRFDELADGFEDALKASANELTEKGHAKADQICEKILQSGGYKEIL